MWSALTALRTVMEASRKLSLLTVAGLPLTVEDKLYNCAAVLAAARSAGVDPKLAEKVFARAERPAGRNERFEKAGRDCILNLVKNPTGANEVMKDLIARHL